MSGNATLHESRASIGGFRWEPKVPQEESDGLAYRGWKSPTYPFP